MSSYLNSKKASLLYKDEALATYFVDKTAMLDELIPVIEQTELIERVYNPRSIVAALTNNNLVGADDIRDPGSSKYSGICCDIYEPGNS